ncbi:MAG: metal-dependent transcriptional regulator [bacterium]|nr:metal-dependent transcriptional regulator [bacterium]
MELKLIEEALSIIWEAIEEVAPPVSPCLKLAGVESELTKRIGINILSELSSSGYIEIQETRLQFTPEGERKAANIIRRQRLAERLLLDILDRPKGEIDSDACEFEHIISPGVEESICILLGHPRECPHGSPIPEGSCCKHAQDTIASIVVQLAQLKPGESGRIVYLSTRNHPELERLLQFGLVPGKVVRMHQTYPSVVIQVNQTQLAFATETAAEVFVRRVEI